MDLSTWFAGITLYLIGRLCLQALQQGENQLSVTITHRDPDVSTEFHMHELRE